jgi:serine/threonine-protein kinase
MPFYSNGSLARALHGNEPFTEDHVARLLLEISDALNYLHTQEPAVLHRDIKPDNILIANDGSYILSDFGISRRVRHTIAKHTGKGSEDSMSIAYSAPERFAKFPQTTAASDIFSLGVMLYQVCSGFLPWDENGGIALLRGAEIPDIPTGYSRKLNEIINQCMDPDPDKRPTAAQLKEWSLTYVKEGYWKLNSTVAIEKKPRKNVYALPILATTVLLLAILFFVLYSREAEVKPIAAEPAKAEQVTENSSDANSEQTDSTLVETDTKPGPTPPANNKTNSDMSSGNTGTGKNKQTKPVPSQGNQTDEKEREVLLEKKRKEQKELEKMLKEEIDQEKKNKSLETN